MRYDRKTMGPTRWALARTINHDMRGIARIGDEVMETDPYVEDQSPLYFRQGRERRKLNVTLPIELVPQRDLVHCRVTPERQGAVTVTFERTGELFQVPRPGHYAWQSGSTHRTVSFPIEQMFASPKATDRLEGLLKRSGTKVYVRVTPSGVQLRVQPYGWTRLELGYEPLTSRRAMIDSAIARAPVRVHDEVDYTGCLEFGRAARRVADGFVADALRYAAPKIDDLYLRNCRCSFTNLEEGRKTAMAGKRIVSCQFAGSTKEYAYHTDDETIVPGDHVVVASPFGNDGHYDASLGGYLTIVRVSSVTETVEAVERVVKWVVSKIDKTGAAERQARAEEIAVLDAKIKKAEAKARRELELRDLRSLSPELRELIDQRDALVG